MLGYVRRHHLGLLALFVALGGTSYAVGRLPAHSVGNRQLKNNAVTSAKVKNHSLKAVDFANGQLPAGAAGPAGAQGPKGDTGPTGAQGPKGDTGAAGTNGSALAYAYVRANSGSPSFDAARTKGFTSVARGSTGNGYYCLTATGIDPASHPVVVSAVWDSGIDAGIPIHAHLLDDRATAGCPAGTWPIIVLSNTTPSPTIDFTVAAF